MKKTPVKFKTHRPLTTLQLLENLSNIEKALKT